MDEKKSHPFDWPGAPGSSEEAANDSATSSSTKFRPPSSIKKDRYRPRLEYEHEQPDHSDYDDDDDDDDDESIHSNDPSQHDGHRPCSCRRLSVSTARSVNPHVLARPATGASLSRADTIISAIRSRRPIPPFTHPLAQQPTTAAVLVDFEGSADPYRPVNWPMRKKVITTLFYGLVTMSSTWCSACYAAGAAQVAREFNIGIQTSTLGTSLYMLGFGLGPLIWAPVSEMYGRRCAVMVPVAVSICFTFGSATAMNIQTLMITRFWCAFFSSAPVTNTGGVLGDIFTPAQRGVAMAGYAMAVVGGPALGPIVSAAFVQNPSLGWRWTEYFAGILQCIMLALAFVLVDESYPPQLLVHKARSLRLATGNWALHAEFEEWDPEIAHMAKKFLLRPVQLLCSPICLMMSLYASFCYGILYMQLGAIPIIFYETRGWGPVASMLPFLGILIGAFIGALLNVFNQSLYNKASALHKGQAVPEKRLPPMMVGSFFFTAGLFVIGWAGGDTSVHWTVPCFGLVILGIGFFTIFQAALNYLVDTFQQYAASAVAATTFLRSVLAAAFPLVVRPLYHNLGIGPGSSIAGGFAALMIPVPFVFYMVGERVRGASKWSRASVVKL
ncbi:Efflux pump bik6 [Ceratocystis lukuohia]|uniref:Efflux pump bik6 n=1 Tax=Ceratocystis lukuohia TaxID=2019550 RepID=A0ABR4MIP3_9PEZI